MRPVQLPQQAQLDFVTPLKAYFVGQQNRRRDDLAENRLEMDRQQNDRSNMLVDRQIAMQDAKLAEYEAGAEQRAEDARYEAIGKKLEADEKYMGIVEKSIKNIDPDSEDFDAQIMKTLATTSNYMREAGIPEDDIAGINEKAIAEGRTSRESVRQLQGQYKAQSPEGKKVQDQRNMGLSDKESEVFRETEEQKPKIIDGMQYKLGEDGNYYRSEIKGDPLPKEKKDSVSPIGKILQDIANLDPESPTYAQDKLNLEAGIKKSKFDPSSKLYDDRIFADETKLRKEFQGIPEVKDYPLIESQKFRLDEAMDENKKSGSKIAVDQALITILNKMLDPTSVVRESEYARTPADQSLFSRLKGKVTKLNTGGAGLTNEERDAIYRMSKLFYKVAKKQYEDQEEYYTGLATDYGFNPKRVIRLGGAKETSGSVEKPKTAEEYLNKWK